MSDSLISVIVPVYNSEQTLHRCIDSILGQTYRNFELLLINDGSKDRSGEICDEYARKDNRVKVFHKENGGVSSARNVGLDNASGEWVTFVDSDDCTGERLLSNLISHTNNHPNVELVISFSEYIFNNGRREEKYKARMVDKANFQILFSEYDMSWHTGPWAKLYSKQVIDNKHLRFNENMNIGEDAVFFYSYLSQIDGLYVSSDTDYKYNADTEGSLTKRVFSLKSEMSGCHNVIEAVDNLLNNGNKWEEKAVNSLCWLKATYMRRVLTALYHNKVDWKTRRTVFRQIDGNFYATYISDSSFKGKILTFFIKNNLFLSYDIVRKLSTGRWLR